MEKTSAYNRAISNYINDNYIGSMEDNLRGKRKHKGIAGKLAGGVTAFAAKKIAKAHKNKVAKKKQKLANTLSYVAKRDNRPIEDVSLQHVENNKEQLTKYVQQKGEVPLENTAELATQAYLLRNEDVNDISETLEVPNEDAEAILDEAEGQLEEMNNPEADSFLGALLPAIANVAKKGLAKIAQSKAKKGKHGLLAKIAGAANKKVNGDNYPDVKQTPKELAEEALNEIKKKEKAAEIKKMMPKIIGAVIVLIIIVVLITNHAGKDK